MLKKLTVVALVAGVFAAAVPVDAKTFGQWLKDLGNSIAHPEKKSRSSGRRKSSGDSQSQSGSPSPTPTVTPAQMIRPATAAPEAQGKKRDVPYGIPVPNRDGFVTSPFAPNEGMVDVRAFPSDTEVKDPYTGKIFRTP